MPKYNKELTDQLPKYLHSLVDFAIPSNRIKLADAWDGLSTETQIIILEFLKAEEYHRYASNLKSKITSTKNNYIRYLLIELSYFDKDNPIDIEILSKLQKSSSQLVKIAATRTHSTASNDVFTDPKTFFEMSLEAQIAYIYLDYFRQGSGKKFTNLIEYAINKRNIPEIDLCDLITEYLSKLNEDYINDIKSYGPVEWHHLDDLKAFFGLIQKFPKKRSITTTIIYKLPIYEEWCGCNADEIADIVIKIDGRYLQKLLDIRINNQHTPSNVILYNLRKKIFLSTNGEFDEQLRLSAALVKLNLTNNEFKILKNENNKKILTAISTWNTVQFRNSRFGKRNIHLSKILPDDITYILDDDLNKEEKIDFLYNKISTISELITTFKKDIKWLGIFFVVAIFVHWILK